jgi:hypothetical protein
MNSGTRCVRLLFGALLLQAGCAVRGLPVTDMSPCPECETTVCADRQMLTIDYLGAGGYLLRRGEDLILLGPFLSNPGFLAAASLKPIEPNIDVLERWLPDVSAANAIIVGHGHYDHLLDVPWIAEHRAKHALVYGSATVAHLLAAVPALEGRVRTLDIAHSEGARAEGAGEPWISIPGTRVRFLPIESEHAPHFAGIKLMQGRIDRDLDVLPRRARGWVEGQTYAFVLQFLHPTEDRALFSLHYQDAASNSTRGFPPAVELDAALVCVASHRQVDGYPERLLEHAVPRHVVLGHWENFLAPYTRDTRTIRGVPFSHPRDFIKRVERYVDSREGSSWMLPVPGAGLRLVACPSAQPR